MTPELSWFTVQLALGGIPAVQAAEGMKALCDELNLRPHLRNPQVYWETEAHRVIIQIDTEDLRADLAGSQMAEELLEIASGVLFEVERVHVEVLSVHLSA